MLTFTMLTTPSVVKGAWPTSEEIVVWYNGPSLSDGMEFDHFKRTHGSQLSRVPAIYWETLHRKLKCEVGGLWCS